MLDVIATHRHLIYLSMTIDGDRRAKNVNFVKHEKKSKMATKIIQYQHHGTLVCNGNIVFHDLEMSKNVEKQVKKIYHGGARGTYISTQLLGKQNFL